MKIDESNENDSNIESKEETFSYRKESASSYDNSAFTVLSDDVAVGDLAKYDGVRDNKEAGGMTSDQGTNVAGARDELTGDDEASRIVDAVKNKDLVGNKEIDNMNKPTEPNVQEINEESMPDIESSLHEVPNEANEDTKPDFVDGTTVAGNEETLCTGTLNKKTIGIETHLDQGQLSYSVVEEEIIKIDDAIEKTHLDGISVTVERLKEVGDVLDKTLRERLSYQLTLDEEEKTELYLQTLESRELLLRYIISSLAV